MIDEGNSVYGNLSISEVSELVSNTLYQTKKITLSVNIRLYQNHWRPPEIALLDSCLLIKKFISSGMSPIKNIKNNRVFWYIQRYMITAWTVKSDAANAKETVENLRPIFFNYSNLVFFNSKTNLSSIDFLGNDFLFAS